MLEMLRRWLDDALWLVTIVICSLLPLPASGHDAAPHGAVPDPELARLAGDFVLTSTFWADPSDEPQRFDLRARREPILGGHVLRLDVGSPEAGFEGTGLMGFDPEQKRYWYTWTDTSVAGVALLHGERHDDGTWRFEGRRPTPGGPAPLIVETRREGAVEIHDYYTTGPGGQRVRFMELRYRPR